jgi:hypothetical protein
MPSFLDYGYIVSGPVTNTPNGIILPLRKFGSELYGSAVQDINMEVTVLTESSVRIKASKKLYLTIKKLIFLNRFTIQQMHAMKFQLH